MKTLTIRTKEEEITVNIIASKRKSIGIEIKPDLTVILRVPGLMKEREIKAFMQQRTDWIIRNYNKQKEVTSHIVQKAAKEIYYEGAMLPLNGEYMLLHIIKGKDSKSAAYKVVRKENGFFEFRIETLSESSEFWKACIIEWYRSYAKVTLKNRAAYYADLLGITFQRVTIKEQKTRWGSCSSKGNLNFNWKLIMMPERIWEYVVVHEVCHRIQMNHSSLFWKEVEKLIPDYRERKEWLKHHGKDFSCY